jgi:multiple sugar transport system ATP-binding protein
MASLTIKAITKAFGRIQALSSVDLDMEDGEFCVLLGPSGCGKSTLLNIVAGLIPQDAGSVLFNGQSVDHLAPRERDVAMVFQSYALYPHMTVAQNLAFGLRMRGASKSIIEERVREAAGLLGILDLLKRKPRELSGGQRQRVAMGRALVRRPSLFLLDEPLSNLDARLRANVRVELKRIHRQIKGTIVYVTHDQVEAMTLGDKVVVMRAGKIHQIGSPDEIYSSPADKFVATFIGSPEMNIYRGKLLSRDSRPYFQGSSFSFDLSGRELPVIEEEIEVGLRPEDIAISPNTHSMLQARVEMVSNLGSEMLVHVRLGEETLTLCAPKDTAVQPGETISLTIDPQKIHVFHKERRL